MIQSDCPKKNQEKPKNGVQEAFDIINRPKKKFELSIMVAGGICKKGFVI